MAILSRNAPAPTPWSAATRSAFLARCWTTSRCRASSTRSCRTTGWASPRRRSASGLGGVRPAARERQAARFKGTRMLANANLCPRKGGAGGGARLLPAGRCSGYAGIGKSLLSSTSEPLAERAGGDATTPRGYPHERPGLRQLRRSCPHPEAGADDGPKVRAWTWLVATRSRRRIWPRQCIARDSVSATSANVTLRTLRPWWLGGVPWLLSLRAAGALCSLLLQPGLCLRSDHVLRERFGRFAREWLSEPKPS